MKQIVIKLSQTVNSVKEAEQARQVLRVQDMRLKAAIDREHMKEISPIVRDLNRRVAKGEVLYFEFCGGKHHDVCGKNDGRRFGLRKDGGLVCGYHDDLEKYTAIDRVYKLNLVGESELLYDRTH
ncbi:MAG: hypothetical protein LBI05_11380 [Planctomycetaceae bacterium]|jgi:hypothetical protein|nr:hypothetical protein [Planctomycetaceae bacterium]